MDHTHRIPLYNKFKAKQCHIFVFQGEGKGRGQGEGKKAKGQGKGEEDKASKITLPFSNSPKLLLRSVAIMLLTCKHTKIRLNLKWTFIALFCSILFVSLLMCGGVCISVFKIVIFCSSVGYIAFLYPTNQ